MAAIEEIERIVTVQTILLLILQFSIHVDNFPEKSDKFAVNGGINARMPQHCMTNDPDKVWPGAVVPFAFHRSIGRRAKLLIVEGMRMIESRTCIKFKSQKIYTHEAETKRNQNVVFGNVGERNTSYAFNFVNVEEGEVSLRRTMQTLFQILGRYHEHQRKDRDSFVTVIQENIIEGDREKFAIAQNSTTQGLPYDFESVTHFRHTEFSLSDDVPTILPKAENTSPRSLGRSQTGTGLDYLHLRLLYCKGTSEMIIMDPPLSGVNFVSLLWEAPEFQPEKYNLEYVCRRQDINGSEYVKKQRIALASDATFVSVPHLLPNSLCELTLFAVYNPASLDLGLKIRASTLKDNESISKFDQYYAIDDEDVLGTGAYSKVYGGICKRTGQKVAVKEIPRERVLNWEKLGEQDYPLEVLAMNRLSHKYVIKLLDYIEDEDEVYIVMEKPTQCTDLCELIQNSGALDEKWARYFFRQLLVAIKYIHSEGVVHNDIKCENILIDLDVPQIKLIDFGFARFLTYAPLTECVGTLMYCPPEYFMHGSYKLVPSTVWTMGLVMYIMLQGFSPFDSEEEIVEGDLIVRTPISEQALSLLFWMLSDEPTSRPTLEEIEAHPWVQNSIAGELHPMPAHHEEESAKDGGSPIPSPLPTLRP